MNLTWHIAKKDLRRFWGPLALLCAVIVLKFGVGVSLLVTNEPDGAWFGHMAVYAHVLSGIGLFVTYMLVAAVIQEDSVASPAFWQTRPISGARLLAAKTLGIVLMFGLLPVLLSIPWWLGCGFGWAEIGGAATETFMIQMGVALLALPWALVTGNYGRFLLWTLVVAVAWVTVALLLLGHAITSRDYISQSAVVIRLLVVGLVAVMGSLSVAIHQFTTRRTWRSIVLVAVTALMMAAAGRWWSWGRPNFWSPQPAVPTGSAKDVSISFDWAYAYVEFSSPESNSVAQIALFAESVPHPYVLSPLYSEQNLRWADGSVTSQALFDMYGRGMPASTRDAYDQLRIIPEPPDQSWLHYSMRRNLFPISFWYPGKGKTFEPFAFALSPAAIRKLSTEKPEYDGTFWFRLLEPQVIGEKEIRIGSVFEKGSNYTRVVAIDNNVAKQALWLTFIERSPEFLWMDFLTSMELSPWPAQPAYGVVNRQRSRMADGNNDTRLRALVANVAIVLRKDAFSGQDRWNALAHRWEKEPENLEEGTLAEVDYSEAQRFSLPLKVDRLSFNSGVAYKWKSAPSAPSGSYTVTGEANKPGTFQLAPGETLVNALRAAGGVSDKGDLTAVVITRATSDGTPSRVVVNVEAWLEDTNSTEGNPALHAGDVIDVSPEKANPPP